MEAFLYQSGPACRIYLLADRTHCPAEDFLTTAAIEIHRVTSSPKKWLERHAPTLQSLPAMKPRLQSLKAKAKAARQTHAYRAEGASIRFTEELVALMKSRGLTRTALAEKIGTSPAYITKILRGDTNFTLDSMVRIAQALDCEVTVGLSPLAPSTAPKPRTNVNYRDSAPIPSPILNDQAKD